LADRQGEIDTYFVTRSIIVVVVVVVVTVIQCTAKDKAQDIGDTRWSDGEAEMCM
jgi:hypothetical protein